MHDVALQMIFDDGNLHETAILRDLQDAGVRVIEQQRDFSWDKYEITGHVDGKVLIDGVAYPLEVKSMSPWAFKKLNSVQDMLESDKHYHQSYPAQLTLYNLLANAEKGVFIIKNKASAELKEIWVPLDMSYAETLIQKAERINEYVRRGETPPPIPWSESICGSCAFNHICLPEAKRDAMELTSNKSLETQLARRAELVPLVREYTRLDKTVKDAVKDHDKIVVGDWLIQCKDITRKGYTVQDTTFRQVDIQSLTTQKPEGV